MQIEFRENRIGCLQEAAVEVLYQEETAELIVPDSYPDVERVVDAAAVCCLRDQEITGGSMTASGAFQASILYTAEGTGEPCAMSAWMPFSVKLSREEIESGGVGCTELRIRSVDARVLNSRKLLIRVSYAARLTAYTKSGIRTWDTEQGDPVQLLRTRQTVSVPVAAAEKTTSFSETVEIPAMGAPLRRIVKTVPEFRVQEQKLSDQKVVWRGELQLRMLCLLENDQVGVSEVTLPVSQYLELGEEAADGTPRTVVSLSEFLMEEDAPGVYMANIGLRFQTVVWKEVELPLIEDGYCTGRDMAAEFEPMRLRQQLDAPTVQKTCEAPLRGNVRRFLDGTVWVDFPVCRRSPDEIAVSASVILHAVYYDDHDVLCGETLRLEESGSFALCEEAACFADAERSGACMLQSGAEGSVLACGITIEARCFSERQVRTMRMAALGDPLPDAAERPSLIVRRTPQRERIWDIAKACGASVRSILDANGLQSDVTEENQLLLIPMS